MNKYDDIISLPHHVSKYYPRMSLEQRSAQFAPYDALEGYSEGVKETERLTSERIILTDEEKEILNSKLNIIKNSSDIEVMITYFVKDIKKTGGSYKNETGYVKKIDIYNQLVILNSNVKIPINEIIGIKLCYNESEYEK
jgi:hypothetical protein